MCFGDVSPFICTLFSIFVILVIFHFGFEGEILGLIAHFPGYCLLVTFILGANVQYISRTQNKLVLFYFFL